MLQVISTSNRKRLGRHAAQVFAFCLVIFCSVRTLEAGVMLAAEIGATSDSMVVDNSSGSDVTDDHAKLKLKHEVSNSHGQHTSSGGSTNPTTSLSVFAGIITAQSEGSAVALIFRLRAELFLNFTNPFLDGILRPPIAGLLV